MSKTYVNGRSVVHQGDGLSNVCAAPDVCKTPSPGGPVPVPYVNVARDSDLDKGTVDVEVGGHPIALAVSFLSTSAGDEPGTAGGGLISSKTKGKMGWASYSLDVKAEGEGVVRFMDATQHNGNTFNSAFVQQGGTGLAYGDDLEEGIAKCPICKKRKPEHRVLETQEVQGFSRMLARALTRVARETQLPTMKTKPSGQRGPVLSGYMIGTLFCKCGQKVFAAMSGFDPLDGFTEAVRRLKQHDGRWTQCETLSPRSEVLNPRGDRMLLSQFENRGNPPGACAAPQLIQQALREGHIPFLMSEVWYRPRLPRRTPQAQVKVTVAYLRNEVMVTRAFRHRQSVPSCKTCQVVLTRMLCAVNEKECG